MNDIQYHSDVSYHHRVLFLSRLETRPGSWWEQEIGRRESHNKRGILPKSWQDSWQEPAKILAAEKNYEVLCKIPTRILGLGVAGSKRLGEVRVRRFRVNRLRKYKWHVAMAHMYNFLPRPNNMENYHFEAEIEKEKHPWISKWPQNGWEKNLGPNTSTNGASKCIVLNKLTIHRLVKTL